MKEYCFNSNEVDFNVHNFGFIFTLYYNSDSCPRVAPVRGDIINFNSRIFKVDLAIDFGDSYDMLCDEVK